MSQNWIFNQFEANLNGVSSTVPERTNTISLSLSDDALAQIGPFVNYCLQKKQYDQYQKDKQSGDTEATDYLALAPTSWRELAFELLKHSPGGTEMTCDEILACIKDQLGEPDPPEWRPDPQPTPPSTPPGDPQPGQPGGPPIFQPSDPTQSGGSGWGQFNAPEGQAPIVYKKIYATFPGGIPLPGVDVEDQKDLRPMILNALNKFQFNQYQQGNTTQRDVSWRHITEFELAFNGTDIEKIIYTWMNETIDIPGQLPAGWLIRHPFIAFTHHDGLPLGLFHVPDAEKHNFPVPSEYDFTAQAFGVGAEVVGHDFKWARVLVTEDDENIACSPVLLSYVMGSAFAAQYSDIADILKLERTKGWEVALLHAAWRPRPVDERDDSLFWNFASNSSLAAVNNDYWNAIPYKQGDNWAGVPLLPQNLYRQKIFFNSATLPLTKVRVKGQLRNDTPNNCYVSVCIGSTGPTDVNHYAAQASVYLGPNETKIFNVELSVTGDQDTAVSTCTEYSLLIGASLIGVNISYVEMQIGGV